jgi:hypothetical protein
MKSSNPIVILLALLALSCSVLATETSLAEYPLTAHVIGSEQGHRPSGAWACTYELAMNNLVYITIHNGKHCDAGVSAGANLPARIEKNKIRVLRNGRALILEVIGTHEGNN